MHYTLHIPLCCLALWCTTHGGDAAKTIVNPEVLTTFAKNVASVLSPALWGELHSSRTNRTTNGTLAKKSVKDPEPSSTSDNIISSPNPVQLKHLESDNIYDRGFRYPQIFDINRYTGGFHDPYIGSKASEDSPYTSELQRPFDFGGNYFSRSEKATSAISEGEEPSPPGNVVSTENAENFNGPSPGFRNRPPFFYSSLNPRHYGPFGFDHHPYPYPGYFSPYGPIHRTDQPAAEGNNPENGQENNNENSTVRNFGYVPGYKHFGFEPYPPHYPPPYPIFPKQTHLFYPHAEPKTTKQPSAENGNEDGNNSTRKEGLPNKPLFQPLYGSFHLQGYPLLTYNPLPYGHFDNVFNHSRPINNVPYGYHPEGYGYPYGYPYVGPYPSFYPGHKFFHPTGSRPTASTDSPVESNANTEAEAFAEASTNKETESVAESNPEMIRAESSNKYEVKLYPSSDDKRERKKVVEQFVFIGTDSYRN